MKIDLDKIQKIYNLFLTYNPKQKNTFLERYRKILNLQVNEIKIGKFYYKLGIANMYFNKLVKDKKYLFSIDLVNQNSKYIKYDTYNLTLNDLLKIEIQ